MKLKTILDGVTDTALLIKDHLNMMLFLEMSNAQWIMAFNASPVSLGILPILATSMLVISAIQIYQFYKQKNKSVDGWINTIGGTLASVLANISIYGGIVAVWAGVSFAAGPWIFLAAASVGLVNQAVMFALHMKRAIQSPENSVQRMEHVQATIHHALMLIMCAVIVTSVVFVMLTPAAPMVGTVFSLLVVSLIAAAMIWRCLPHERKLAIKAFFGMGKPEEAEEVLENKSEKALLPEQHMEPMKDPADLAERKSHGCLAFFDRVFKQDEVVDVSPVPAP